MSLAFELMYGYGPLMIHQTMTWTSFHLVLLVDMAQGMFQMPSLQYDIEYEEL